MLGDIKSYHYSESKETTQPPPATIRVPNSPRYPLPNLIFSAASSPSGVVVGTLVLNAGPRIEDGCHLPIGKSMFCLRTLKNLCVCVCVNALFGELTSKQTDNHRRRCDSFSRGCVHHTGCSALLVSQTWHMPLVFFCFAIR